MDVAKVTAAVIARKCLAVLTLPFVTRNGEIRTVNAPTGQALKSFCGFHYSQATLVKFLAELKYLGVSTDLLHHQVGFWREIWRRETPEQENVPLLCYYVDGNTKALWSTKRVKKNKVTMLGRVMGCLEQVFVHDSHGRPIYFETYSGHAPMGEYILSLFKKIEDSLEGPGAKLPVHRASVMDAASNSVRTLRAFAAQDTYHYITSLDDNQWDPRKIRKRGRPQRYRHGAATLRDCEIELQDSREKGYLFVVRAIEILWDRGKRTYLITSLPTQIIGASLVVKSYFDRWPDEELSFKVMKAVACLHRVAGYGKQKLPDEAVVQRQRELTSQIRELKNKLSRPQSSIEEEEAHLAKLYPKERRLRARSKIVDGKRILPSSEAKELEGITRLINKHHRRIAAIRKKDPDFKRLDRAQREWLRLQGKETVYKVDVELDQIMTYFRVSLVNLYSYLAKLMGYSHLSLVMFLHTVLLLTGRIEETAEAKHVILRKNEKDSETMEALSKALTQINALKIRNGAGQELSFAIEG
jgi:transposase